MDSQVTYTFYLDNAGQAAENLTPQFEVLYDLDESVNHFLSGTTPVADDLVGTTSPIPDIVELGNGFYFFVFDWGIYPGDFYLAKIDCGADNFHSIEQSFVILKLNRNDNLHNVAESIRQSSDDLITSNNNLLKFVKRLLEVEQGTWKIEEENSQYYLRLYPTTDNASPPAPLYETTLSVNDFIAEYELKDENDLSSATNPFQRLQHGLIKPLG